MLFNFIITVIKWNPVKSIFLLLGIVCSLFAGKVSDSIDKYRIVKSDTVSVGSINKYCYITDNFTLKTFDTPQKIVDGYLTEYSYSPGNVFLWVGVGLSLLIIILASFIDDDTRWDFYECLVETYYSSKLRVHDEDGIYRYTINDRLIATNSSQISSYDLKKYVERYVDSKKSLPIWYSKSDKRNKNLDKIGI